MARLTRQAAALAATQAAAQATDANKTNSVSMDTPMKSNIVGGSDAGSDLRASKRQKIKNGTSAQVARFEVEIRESVHPMNSAESSTTSGGASPNSFQNEGSTETPATSISDGEDSWESVKQDPNHNSTKPVTSKVLKSAIIPDSDEDSSLSELDASFSDPEDDIYESDFDVKVSKSEAKGKGKAVEGADFESDFDVKVSKSKAKAKGKGKGKAVEGADSESDFNPESDEHSDEEMEDLDEILPAIKVEGESSKSHSKKSKSRSKRLIPNGEPCYDVLKDKHWPTAAQRRHMTNQERRQVTARFSYMSRAEKDAQSLYSYHPYLKNIYKDLEATPTISVEEDPQPEGLNLKLLPFQKEGLHWLRLQEQGQFGGGILADEMGMGKTIQTLSLIMTDPKAKPNLVVAPTVAMMQWKSEIEKYTGSAMSIYIYHGTSRLTDPKELSKYNIILTTYNVLESVFRKQEFGFKRKAGLFKEKSALHNVKYHRVILDEAHNIKDRSSGTAKAVYALDTKYKLCLSGTPLQNRIGELFSLLRFLQIDPFAYYYCRNCTCKQLHWKFTGGRGCDHCGCSPMSHVCFFNWSLLKPIQNNGSQGEGAVAFRNIHTLMKHIMLRRTKNEREEDLGLPPKVVRIRNDKFSEEENDIYGSLFGDTKRTFNTYVEKGVVLNNYANIFGLIMKLRQMADHPDLILRKHAAEGQNMLVCFLCDDEAEDAIKSKCHHTFCRDCIQRYVESYDSDADPECPKCHITLSIDLTAPALEEINVKKHSIISRIDMSKWRSSTKIEALCEELYKLRTPNQTTKSIVFSQFTSMLQLIEWRLHHAGFKTVMLEGTMSPTQREASIKHFMENVECEVFLVSLKAGGVALNLIEASQVFIMDPWWNPAVEWQAADRIHRIGQKRVCRITRMVISDSIESRIVELQEKKAQMIAATVNADTKAMERLTPDDMAFLFQN